MVLITLIDFNNTITQLEYYKAILILFYLQDIVHFYLVDYLHGNCHTATSMLAEE